MTASHLNAVPGVRRKLLALLGVFTIAVGAVAFTRGPQVIEQLRSLLAYTPPHLVSAIATSATPSATIVPLMKLSAVSAVVFSLLFVSFRRSLFAQSSSRASGRTFESVLWFPGRLGGLVRKEQLDFRKLMDVWPGALLVVAVSVASLFGSLPPIVRQAVIIIVFVLNTNLILNCFGVNTTAELNRYAILPLRGRDVLLVKNLGFMVIVAAQLALLIVVAAWRSGPSEVGAEVLVVAVLLLSHLAWGNLASVSEPFRMPAFRLTSNGSPLTAMFGMTIGSAPGVMVLILLSSESSSPAAAIAGVVLLSLAAYLGSLHYAGRMFERRRHIIAQRLS